ncbi:F-box domain containing protein [Tanacetum coccineum]
MEEDSLTFSRLPDEMILQILCKVIDLKTLCLCKLVSKCFHRIVLQVDTICFTSPFNSFNYPLVDPPNLDWNDSAPVASLGSFGSAIWSLKKFERVKSLSIHLSSSYDNCSLFKWKIKFGNTLDSLLFLSPTLIFKNRIVYVRHVNEEDEEDLEKLENKVYIMEKCLKDAIMRIRHEELPDEDDNFWKNDDFDDEKDEAVYNEAVINLLKNYRNRFVTSPINYRF